MTKKVAMLVFNSRFSAHRHYDDGSVEKNPDYVDSMQNWVERALEKGIKVEATAREAKSLLEEMLGTIPDEKEPETIIRYGLKTKGGRKSFVSYAKAEDHYKKYCARFGYPMSIKEVEVKA